MKVPIPDPHIATPEYRVEQLYCILDTQPCTTFTPAYTSLHQRTPPTSNERPPLVEVLCDAVQSGQVDDAQPQPWGGEGLYRGWKKINI